jgi:phosphate transport system substrate-binding protein
MIRGMKYILFIGICAGLIFAVSSCKKGEIKDGWTDTTDSGLIRIACDENFKHLVDAEIMVFEANYPFSSVIPVYVNEAEAIRLLMADSVRFALVTRSLSAKENQTLREKNRIARKNIIGFDGITFITHPENPDSIISVPVLQKILSGEITDWSQIYPNSQLGKIQVLLDNEESGTLRYVSDSIHIGDNYSPNLYALNNGLEVVEKVTKMPNALGIIGFNLIGDETNSDAKKLRAQVRLMRVSKDEKIIVENSFYPYAGDLRHEDYPFWRPVYVLLTDPRAGLSSTLSIFFAQQVGQKIIQKCGLLPATDSQNMSVRIISDEQSK